MPSNKVIVFVSSVKTASVLMNIATNAVVAAFAIVAVLTRLTNTISVLGITKVARSFILDSVL